MTLNLLKYAIIVAESESFNEAAKKLFISQPSLSTSIHSLEEEIGVQIFRRSQNGIAVTLRARNLSVMQDRLWSCMSF